VAIVVVGDVVREYVSMDANQPDFRQYEVATGCGWICYALSLSSKARGRHSKPPANRELDRQFPAGLQRFPFPFANHRRQVRLILQCQRRGGCRDFNGKEVWQRRKALGRTLSFNKQHEPILYSDTNR
jgi:hypothetical protein